MAYTQFHSLPHVNFQINRVFTYGEKACREKELWEAAGRISEFNIDAWYEVWRDLGQRAESEERFMHAAYYYRMAEFYMPDGRPEKQEAYARFRSCFYKAVEDEPIELFEAPYGGVVLPVMRLKAENEKDVIVIHGGYDSFMEEFFLESKKLMERGYTVVIFEGPGQGRTLREGLKMTPKWEKPTSTVLDYMNLDDVTLVGISLGGYLCLRAAAYEPRIKRVAAYDVIYDGLGGFTRHFPAEFRRMIEDGQADRVNEIIGEARKTSDLVDWAVAHGLFITGTETPFDYLSVLGEFHAGEISPLIKQDVLLLAGENDHLVPLEQFDMQKNALTNARSVHGRIFTAEEGGDQHCQVGNLDLAWDEITNWVDKIKG